jgi:hypothetical protein
LRALAKPDSAAASGATAALVALPSLAAEGFQFAVIGDYGSNIDQ